ncbi:MFS transporter [Streptomyces sp. NPDC046557]|uniref:MFS transporter n=1 Tax=Streptomyces sp. NPDC046557 TaxID=3155372 RepID=UPI0034066604
MTSAEARETPTASGERPPHGLLRRWPLLHSLNFRLFALGQGLSNTGTWVQKVAQDWLALELSHGDARVLAVTTALQFLPLLLLGPYPGVLVDRYSTLRALLATQAAMGVLALTGALLVLTQRAGVNSLYMLALLFGVAMAVEKPALQAFIPEAVGPDHLVSALSFNSAVLNLARMVGPALAGPVIVCFGPGPAFLANAASYLAVIACLLRMDTRALRPAPPVPYAQKQVREGLRYVRGHPDLARTLTLVAVVAAFGMNFQITTTLMATQVYHSPAAIFGIGNAALAAGSVIGALLAANNPRSGAGTMAFAALAFGFLETTSSLMPGQLSFLLILVPTGIALLVFLTIAKAQLQQNTVDGIRGRVMSLYILASLGTTPLLAPAVGWLAHTAGPRTPLAVGGVVSAAVAAAALHSHRRQPPVK